MTDLATTANRFAFTGHVFETETGLYYAKARFLDPQLGRFISQDSFLGQIDEPPSLHRYLYANANPTRYVDPTGHEAFGVDIEMSGVVDPRTKEDVRRAEVRGVAGLAATISWFGKQAWGIAQQALGRGWEGFGEAVVEAGRHPIESLKQAAGSLKAHVNEQMDIAQERMARGDDWGAAWGFTENVTAPLSTAALTAGEGTATLGKAVLRPTGPALERVTAALREASEAQARRTERNLARAVLEGRSGEIGVLGEIPTREQAAALLSSDCPMCIRFDPPVGGTSSSKGALDWFTEAKTPWGRRAYQRPDLDIGWDLVRPEGTSLAGKTNWEAATQGYAPGRINPATGKWDDLILHHANQDPRGAVIETWRSSHGSVPHQMDPPGAWRRSNPAWGEAWKREQSAYWRWRTGEYNPPPTGQLRLPGDR